MLAIGKPDRKSDRPNDGEQRAAGGQRIDFATGLGGIKSPALFLRDLEIVRSFDLLLLAASVELDVPDGAALKFTLDETRLGVLLAGDLILQVLFL